MNKVIMNEEDVKKMILSCEIDKHKQQVAYSVHMNTMTQICFDCDIVRTNYEKQDEEKQVRTFDFIENDDNYIYIFFDKCKCFHIHKHVPNYGIYSKISVINKDKLVKFELTTMDKLEVCDVWCFGNKNNYLYYDFYYIVRINDSVKVQYIDQNNNLNATSFSKSNDIKVWRLIK